MEASYLTRIQSFHWPKVIYRNKQIKQTIRLEIWLWLTMCAPQVVQLANGVPVHSICDKLAQ